MGRKLAELLEEREQLGVDDVREWIRETDTEPFLNRKQISDIT